MRDYYALQNIKRIKWGVLEENKPISLYPVMYPGWCNIIKHTGSILGFPQRNIICLHRRDSGLIFVDHFEWTRLGEYTLRKILKRPEWGFGLNQKIIRYADELVRFTAQHIANADLKQKTNRQLLALYREYEKRHSQLYDHAIIPVYLDLYKPHLTTYLIEYLSSRVRFGNYQHTAKEYFAELTIPEQLSKVQLEELDLLKLAASPLKKNSRTFSYQKRVTRHDVQKSRGPYRAIPVSRLQF